MTTFKEVYDELVAELGPKGQNIKEEKNVIRRVYDALNVLISIGIIKKSGQ